jgi:hypothetical protein
MQHSGQPDSSEGRCCRIIGLLEQALRPPARGGDLPGYFRKPFGPGWALLGDAGYHKHPITAMAINDAFATPSW